ncbi:MAG: vitamin K epoxide reductase family protein [Patescibacteria group bacterium]
MNNTGRILTILAALGLAVSIYLTFKTYDPSSVACSIGGGCETVLTSRYAYFLGIPVSIFGIMWYVAQLGILYSIVFRGRLGLKELRIWAVLGLAFSLYLLAAEIFLIHAYCTWCLVSLGIVLATTILLFLPNLKGVNNE